MFTGWLEADGDALVPHIQGRAFITVAFHAALRSPGSIPARTCLSVTSAPDVIVIGAGLVGTMTALGSGRRRVCA